MTRYWSQFFLFIFSFRWLIGKFFRVQGLASSCGFSEAPCIVAELGEMPGWMFPRDVRLKRAVTTWPGQP